MWSLLAALPLVAPTQDAPSLRPRADFLTDDVRRDVRLSPDGARVGYLRPDDDGVLQLHVAPLEGAGDAPAVTVGDAPVREWAWAHSNEHVVFTRQVEGGATHLFVVPRQGGSTFDVTRDLVGDTWLLGNSRQWPTHVALECEPEGEERGVWLLDFVSQERHRMCDGGYDRYVFDGNMWPAGASRGDRIVRMLSSGEWEEVSTPGTLEGKVAGVVGANFMGGHVFYVDQGAADRATLRMVDLEDGQVTALAEHPRADLLPTGVQVDGRTLEPVSLVTFRGGLERVVVDREALAHATKRGEPITRPVDEHWARLDAALAGDVHFVDQDTAGARWLVAADEGGRRTYHLYDTEDGALRPLFGAVPSLEDAAPATRTPFPVTARDGLELPCQLYRPADAPEGPLPMVVFVHGGPWSAAAYDGWETHRHLQLLASRGYAVLAVEFRGAVGHGRAFLDAGDRALGTTLIDDVVDATRAAVAAKVAREDALAVFGWSYGGYAALRVMTHEPELFTCGLALGGMSDLLALQQDKQDQPAWRALWNARVGDPTTEAGAALLKAQSPLADADKLAAPLLLGHGALDLVVPKEQSDAFARAAHAAGREVTYLVFPKEPHELRKARSWSAWWAVGEQFLAQHLGGAAQPFYADLEWAEVVVAVGAEHVEGLAEATR